MWCVWGEVVLRLRRKLRLRFSTRGSHPSPHHHSQRSPACVYMWIISCSLVTCALPVLLMSHGLCQFLDDQRAERVYPAAPPTGFLPQGVHSAGGEHVVPRPRFVICVD